MRRSHARESVNLFRTDCGSTSSHSFARGADLRQDAARIERTREDVFEMDLDARRRIAGTANMSCSDGFDRPSGSTRRPSQFGPWEDVCPVR